MLSSHFLPKTRVFPVRWVQRGESQLDRIKQDMPLFQGISCFAYFGSWKIGRNRRLFWETPSAVPRRLGAHKCVRGNHPLDGSLSLFVHLSGGNASRSGVYGGQPYTARPLTGAVPLCHFVTFPPHSGGIFLLSLRDISPAPPPHREHSVQFTAVLIFAICVQAQPALLKKAGENFTFCSPLALCLPLEPILIPDFIQVIAADFQAFQRIQSIRIVLLNQEVFAAALESGFDAVLDFQAAAAEL